MTGHARRLIELSDLAWDLYAALQNLGCVVRPSIPILYFGNLERYLASPIRVVTAALNPSRLEFPRDDPFARFPGLRNCEGRPANADFLGALNEYFRVNPY